MINKNTIIDPVELMYRINFIARYLLDDGFERDIEILKQLAKKHEAMATPIICIVPPYIKIETPLYYFKCPSCNTKFTGKGEPTEVKPHYCPICAQKILPYINEATHDAR